MTNTRTLARPASVTEWLEREQARTPFLAESARYGMAYQPQPSDLFISPYAKCGATWLQQIVHGLRTRGAANVDDAMQTMPWLELAHSMSTDLTAPQPGGFRAFKSHLSWTKIPKGGHYIVSFRDPKDALVSLYNFMNGYNWQTESVSMTEFAGAFYLKYQDDDWDSSYWGHLVSWWEQHHNPRVLLLTYEGIKADLPTTVDTIAHFLGIELSPDLLKLILKQASLEFLLTKRSICADPVLQEVSARQGSSPPGETVARVKTDQVGDHRTQLPAEISLKMDAIWQEMVAPRTGLASYQALAEALESR
jgi:hypothetical protein